MVIWHLTFCIRITTTYPILWNVLFYNALIYLLCPAHADQDVSSCQRYFIPNGKIHPFKPEMNSRPRWWWVPGEGEHLPGWDKNWGIFLSRCTWQVMNTQEIEHFFIAGSFQITKLFVYNEHPTVPFNTLFWVHLTKHTLMTQLVNQYATRYVRIMISHVTPPPPPPHTHTHTHTPHPYVRIMISHVTPPPPPSPPPPTPSHCLPKCRALVDWAIRWNSLQI